MHIVIFIDAQLQKCYEHHFVEEDDLPDDLRPVHALIATHDLFRMLEGPHSRRVHEILKLLTSGELRPALRSWYQRSATDVNADTKKFREELNKLTGEQLEIPGGHAS